jgi:hypothetical protein
VWYRYSGNFGGKSQYYGDNCAQSAHHHTNCEVYDFLPEEKIVELCKLNESEGVDRFSIVTAGKALTGKQSAIVVFSSPKNDMQSITLTKKENVLM